jgi:chromosomal replication initiation ATPase DnaA|tara:strand:+ start:214 stop:678 length:465 start_codon:yes stop_codon:yes gene_type:complete
MYGEWKESVRLRGGLSILYKQLIHCGGREGEKDRRLQAQKEARRSLMARYKYNGDIVISFKVILNNVAEAFDISVKDLQSDKRGGIITYSRWFVIGLATRYTNLTTTAIANRLHLDHTSVLYARNHLQKKIDNDDDLQNMWLSLTQELEETYGL